MQTVLFVHILVFHSYVLVFSIQFTFPRASFVVVFTRIAFVPTRVSFTLTVKTLLSAPHSRASFSGEKFSKSRSVGI